MGNDLILREQELVDNPTPRVPVCLVLDCSYSMSGKPINELNEGVGMFFNAIKNDEVAKHSAEISIITFGNRAEMLLDFASIDSQEVPQLSANGSTPMGEAVTLAIDKLQRRKNEYSNAGVDYYQPWVVLMTDGKPTDDIQQAAKKTVNLIENKKLTIFPIGIGKNADMIALEEFSPKRKPLRLKGLNFSDFFEWLSMSVSRVSQSIPGEKVKLDTEKINDWAEI